MKADGAWATTALVSKASAKGAAAFGASEAARNIMAPAMIKDGMSIGAEVKDLSGWFCTWEPGGEK